MPAIQPADLGIGRLFATVRDAVVAIDVATERIVLWNPAAERLFGYSVAEAIGLPVAMLVPERLREAHRTGLARYRETGHGRLVDGQAPVELLALRRSGEELWIELTLSPVEQAAVAGHFVLAIIRDCTERKQAEELRIELQQRQATVLALARRLAAEDDAGQLLSELLAAAVPAAGGAAGIVYRWEPALGWLAPIRNSQLNASGVYAVRPGEGAVGLAVEQRRPVVVADCQVEPQALEAASSDGVRSLVVVPMVYEGALVGALAVASFDPARRFDETDTEVLQILAGLGAARLIGQQRGRLTGVLLAARTAEHELNNKLAVTKGYAQLIARDPSLPRHLRRYAQETIAGVDKAAGIVDQLQQITRVEETDWGLYTETTLDLARSTDAASGATP